MLRKLTKRMLASLLALTMVLPGSSIGTLQSYAEETTEQTQFFVDVDDADKTTTGESMKIQYSTGATWKSAKKDSYASILYGSSETYSAAGGTEYYYTMNFTGTGVQIFGAKNPNHAVCDVYIDDIYAGELNSNGTTKQFKQLLFESFGLENKEHNLKVVRKEDDTRNMQLDMIRVYTANQVNYVDIDDAVSTQGSESFKISYLPAGAWTGAANHPELFFDATEHYTQQSASSLSYEIPFIGTGIAIFASMAPQHANCDVYIDDVKVGDLTAYTSGDKQHKQILFETYGLENEEHMLRVVKKSDDSKALQLDKIRVFYDTLFVNKISLNTDEIRMRVGSERQMSVTTEPWLVPAEITWSSADESVATVDENGLIRAVATEEAETIVTASVVGTEVKAEVKVVVDPNVRNIAASVGDEKLLDTQREYEELLAADPVYTWEGTAWKGDTLNSKIIVLAKDAEVTGAEVTASDFTNENGDVLSAENFSIKWLKEVQAYNGRGNKQGELLSYPDMIHKGGKTDIAGETVKFAWVAINVPEDAEPGTYVGTISVHSDEMDTTIDFTYTVKVLDLVQPELNVTDIQFWQHPFSVANYYLGLGDDANIGSVCNEYANDFYFTDKHLNLMRAEMEEYASMGGHDLVATIVEEAWNHQSFYGDPSMIKWTKNADGTWTFDYTWFDIWVEFAIECGVIGPETGLGQIKCYSVVPWGNYVSYFDVASNSTVKKAYTPGNEDWEAIWTPFLTDFMAHTKEKGWFDITYISMDERTLDQLEPTVELIESLSDENGVHFKISSCLNYSAPDYYDFTDHIDDISVGLKHTEVDVSNAMSEHRRELGLKTTYYTCTGDYPSNFIISDPGDNYWNAWYTMTLGTDGYLRWAWDNFLYDMHGNVSYKSWEPGDCWFIYPVEREEVDMEGDCAAGFYRTPRYEMLKQGLRDVAKANYLMEQSEGLHDALETLTGSIARPQKGSLNGSATYANETQRMLVHSETDRVFAGMTALAEDYANGVTVERKLRVACVGDSLTDGYKSSNGNKSSTAYPAYLQQLLGDDYNVENFGKSSMTMIKDNGRSYWNTAEFSNSLEFKPDIVIIMLGTNDCKNWNEAAFRADAIALVNEYKALDTNPRIIFAVSPNVYLESGADITREKMSQVIPVQRALVEENGWESIDMYEKTEGKEYFYNADLIHFTDSGYFYVAQCMHEAITGESFVESTDTSRDIPLEALVVTAVDSQAGEGPERVVDNESATLWHTNWYGTSTANHWIQFEVAEDYKVDGLRYQPRQNGKNGIITKYEVQVSDDGTDWETVASGDWAEDSIWKRASFEAVEVKYVRLVSKSAYTGNAGYVFASAAEIRLTGEKIEEIIPEPTPTPEATPEPTPGPEVCKIFSDVKHGAWYESAIQYVFDNDIMSGNGGLFTPTGNITRAQVVTTLYKLEGKPEVTDRSAVEALEDVETGKWYTDAVCWAYNLGITTGNTTTMTFGMSDPVTRQQLASFLYRYAQYKELDVETRGELSGLLNADKVSKYAKDAVEWAVGTGFISGSEVTDSQGNKAYDLKPAGNTTRAQAATILMRFCVVI